MKHIKAITTEVQKTLLILPNNMHWEFKFFFFFCLFSFVLNCQRIPSNLENNNEKNNIYDLKTLWNGWHCHHLFKSVM